MQSRTSTRAGNIQKSEEHLRRFVRVRWSRTPSGPKYKTILLFVALSLMSFVGCSSVTCFNPPTITNQSSDQTVVSGGSAIFTVAAIGTGTLSYQWQRNGQTIPGAAQPTYILPAAGAADSGASFTVQVSSALGQVRSVPALLTVTTPPTLEIRYVSPKGDDMNTGTIDQPYQTIQRCASTMTRTGTCAIRTGVYRETVVPNDGISISAYHLESVTIDGADPITGWIHDNGSVYEAKVILNGDDTNQIFVDSEMMTEARWPNGNDLFHVNWATAKAGTDASHLVDSKLPKVDWAGAKVHLWSGSDPFSHQTGDVTYSRSGQIDIDVGQVGTCPSICPTPGGYYYLFGTLSALDAEKEWFYDANATKLYFIAPGGVDPNKIQVRSKRRPYAFDLRGKNGVTISNVAIFASTIVTDQQSSNNTLDRINATYISHFTNLPVAPSDHDGTDFSILQVHEKDSGIVLAGKANIIKNSTISFSAGAGIALEGTGNTVLNNLIQNIDYIGDYASGIDLDGNNNVLKYNTITNAGRQGIYVQATQDEDISYNNLFNGMLLTRDGAEIYACCLQQASGSRIHHNWLHDTQVTVSGQGDSYALSGVGIDNGSGGFDVEQNVLWGNQKYNILINGVSSSAPNNNHLINNSIPDSSSDGLLGIISVQSCASTRVVDNQLVVNIELTLNATSCTLVNNAPSAPGATDMSSATKVGCNFAGCSSNRPPKILDNGDVTICPVISP
jgi:hypothetical protein